MVQLSQKLSKLNGWYYDLLLLTVITGAFYAAVPPFFGWDNGWCALHGMNIFNGQGYVGPETGARLPFRGPLYPLMIALSFLGGIDAQHAFLPVYFFALVTPLVVYWFSYLVAGRMAGILAAVFYLTSIAANFSILRPIDNIWGVVGLVAVCFFISALRKNSLPLSLLSGVVLGGAYLTKEAALLLFPVPFLLWLMDEHYRKKGLFKQVVVTTSGAVVIAVGWTMYAKLASSQNVALGAQGEFVFKFLLDRFTLSCFLSELSSLLNNIFLRPLSWPGLLLPLGLLASFILSFRQTAFCPIVIWACCLSPLMVYVAMRSWHPGYYTPLYLMCFVAMGAVFATVYRRLTRQQLSVAANMVMCCLLVGYAVWACTTPSQSTRSLLARQSRLSLNPAIPLELSQRNTARPRVPNMFANPVAVKLWKELEWRGINRAVVMSDSLAYALAFLSKGSFQPTLFSPVICHGTFRSKTRYTGRIPSTEVPLKLSIRKTSDYYLTVFASQERLLSTLREYGPKLVVSGRGYVTYLQNVGWARKLEGTHKWGLYDIDLAHMVMTEELFITNEATQMLWEKLKQGHPHNMQELVSTVSQCFGEHVTQNRINGWLGKYIPKENRLR